LIFANVGVEDILLKEDLDQLAKEDKSFRVHYVLNNPPEKWDGGVGFVTPEMIQVCPPHLHYSHTMPARQLLIRYGRNGSQSQLMILRSCSAGPRL
jgi:hypothetical protein